MMDTVLTFDDFLNQVDFYIQELSKNVQRASTSGREWRSTDNGNHARVSIFQHTVGFDNKPDIALTQHKNSRGEIISKGLEPFLFRTEQDAKKAAEEILQWFKYC